MSPKDVHILEYVTLHGTRDCVDVIKLRILRWGIYSGLSGSSVVTKVFVRGRQESQSLKRSCEDRNKSWSDVIWRWRKGLKAKESRWPLEAGKGKDICFLLQLPEGMRPCLDFWILGFLNCEIKNLFSATKFVSICFGCNKKLIHLLWLVRPCMLAWRRTDLLTNKVLLHLDRHTISLASFLCLGELMVSIVHILFSMLNEKSMLRSLNLSVSNYKDLHSSLWGIILQY